MDDSPSTGTQARTWPSLSSNFCSILPVDDTIAPIYGQPSLWEHTIGSGATTFAKPHHKEPSKSSYNIPRNESRRLLDEFERLLILDETSTAPLGGPISMGMSDNNDMVAESLPINDLARCPGLHGISLQATMGPTGFLTSAQTVTAADVDKSPSPRSCTSNMPPSLFPVKLSDSYDVDVNLERHAQPTTDKSQPQPSPSSGNPRARQKALLHKTKHGNAELWRTRIRATTKMLSQKKSGPIQALYKCDRIGCYKAFLRNEHLKRHKQVSHSESPSRFSCEFCGNQFNRQDNLAAHRRRHAEPGFRKCGVKFIQESVSIIEQEEVCRRQRTVTKPKTLMREAVNSDENCSQK